MIPPFSEPSRFAQPHLATTRSRTVGAPRLAAALAVALFTGLAACASDADPEATQRASSASTSARFVGCRPSPGECRASCPDRRFRFVDPDARCPAAGDAPNDTGACLCGDEAPPPPERPEGVFFGCRPSAGECLLSCPTRRGAYVEGWPDCPAASDPAYVRGGCFCQ